MLNNPKTKPKPNSRNKKCHNHILALVHSTYTEKQMLKNSESFFVIDEPVNNKF